MEKTIRKMLKKTGKYINCEFCGKEKYFAKWEVKRSKRHFCSKECLRKMEFSLRVKLQCSNCSKSFFRERHKINNKSKNIFCSPKCQQKYQRGKNNPLYGKKCPLTSKRMKLNNPTKSLKIRLKISRAIKKFYENGNIHPLLGKHPSLETRLKMSKAKGGNGIVLVDRIYPRKFNVILKNRVRKRDNYQCQNCGMTEEEHLIVYGLNLDVHHIDYNKENCKENNLISLCKQCNTRANFNRDYWQQIYKEKLIGVKQ